jgi:hypothetical protein
MDALSLAEFSQTSQATGTNSMVTEHDTSDIREACRGLYCRAEGDFILPPLLRRADGSDDSSFRHCFALNFAGGLRFIVEFDKAYVESADLPLDRLPLRFMLEEQNPGVGPIQGVGELERAALIRAFLLGAKAPIKVSPIPSGFAIFLQLSETYFFDIGRIASDVGVADPIFCDRISAELLSKSEALFASHDDGLEVWRTKVAQQLLGGPVPEADFLWPHGPFSLPIVTDVSPGWKTANSEELIHNGVWPLLVTNEPSELPSPSLNLPTVVPVVPKRRSYPVRGALVASVVAAGLALAVVSYSIESTIDDVNVATFPARAEPLLPQAPPLEPLTQHAAVSDFDQPSRPAGSAMASASLDHSESQELVRIDRAVVSEIVSQPIARVPAAKKKYSAPRQEKMRQASARSGANSRPHAGRASNPIVVVGQIVRSMTSSVAKNLQKISYALDPSR